MFMLKNTSKSLKIQIQDLAEEQCEIGQTHELSAEELNLVAGGEGIVCSATGGCASEECHRM